MAVPESEIQVDSNMLRIGLVGCGTVGRIIARNLGLISHQHTLWVHDRHRDRMESICSEHSSYMPAPSLDDLQTADLDFLLESASRDFVRTQLATFLGRGVNVIVLSNGALVDDTLRRDLVAAADKGDSRIYLPGVPPGAGTVLALQLAGIRSVKYASRRNLDHSLARKAGSGVYFSGPVRQAMTVFPTSLNSSAALAEAGVGYDLTEVEVAFDPQLEGYSLELNVHSTLGTLQVGLSGPFVDGNPAFSELAAFSVIALLKKLTSRVVVGI